MLDIETINVAVLSIVSLTNLVLGAIILRYARKDRAQKWFVGVIVSIVAWTIVNYLADHITNHFWSLTWTKMTFSTTTFLAWFLLLFAIEFGRAKKVKWWVIALTFLPNLLVQALLFTPYIVRDITRYDRGVNVVFGGYDFIFTIFFLGSLIVAIGLLIRLYWIAKDQEYRSQIIYMLLGLGLFLVAGTITNYIIPLVFNYFYASVFGPYFSIFFIGLTTYAILRHKLLKINILTPQLFTLFIGPVLFVEIILSPNVTQVIIRTIIFLWYVVLAVVLLRSIQREARLVNELSKANEGLQKLTTNLKEANTHLKELMEVKTEFLHIASHQLRTPLTSMRGLLEMQAHGDFEKLTEEKRNAIQKDMLSGVNQLNNIVNDLLDAMELEGGSLNFKLEQVQTEDVIEEAMKTLKFNYDKKGLKLIFEKPSSPLPKMECDAEYLRQVFMNIIDNAEKYTREGGTTVCIAKKSNNIEVTFTDTGIGIDPEEKSKLFGKFVRGRRSQSIHTDGSGLGLFIIKKIVEEHHGKVSLESEGVGKGTTFRVTLPINQPK